MNVVEAVEQRMAVNSHPCEHIADLGVDGDYICGVNLCGLC